MNELILRLQSYLLGAAGFSEIAEWLAGVDWDDPSLTEAEQEMLGLFELLLTEVAEGLREEKEFWEEAVRFVVARRKYVLANDAFRPVPNIAGTADSTSSISTPQKVVVSVGSGSQS